jgi:dihydrodipicolinate reductase
VAGATGWAGSELSRAIAHAADLSLVAAVARRRAREGLGQVLSEAALTAPICARDVFVEYTGAREQGIKFLKARSGLASHFFRRYWR